MKHITTLLLIFLTMSSPTTIFNFTKDSNLNNWRVVDDVVMGGRSNGNFKLNTDGHAVFSGKVSIENNGGFSSLRYNFETLNVKTNTKICIKIKGDGKAYQFRIKANDRERFSYITSFKTSGKWELITINLKDMYPSFRGRTLNYPNFDKNTIEELAFLIGNKKAENFKLLIDNIVLE